MNSQTPTQERLEQELRRRAAGVAAPDFGMDRVQSRARRIRRVRRARIAVVACAVVAAVVVPTAVLLRPGGPAGHPAQPVHSGPPSPAPTAQHPPTPKRTPTPHRTRGSAVVDDLAAIPQGPGTFLSFVGADGVVHEDGSTSHLPGRMDPSTEFLSYRDGWLVAGADNRLREYDGSGKVVASGSFGGMTLTDDRTRAAWIMGGELYQAGRSTMGEATRPEGVPVPASAALIGYLPQGAVLTGADSDSIRIATGSGSLETVRVGLFATTTSQAGGLVGGSTGTPARGNVEGAVYDLGTHARLWRNGWMPLRFSDDGSLVAAYPAGENGDPSAIAILDARTGRVVARTPRLSGLYLGRGVAWDDHRLLIPAAGDGGTRAALLALDTSGHLTRASEVARSARPGDAYLILAAQP